MYNRKVLLWHLPIIEVLPIFMGTMLSVDIIAPKNGRAQSVNNFHFCIFYNTMAMLPHLPIIAYLLTFMGNMGTVDVAPTQMSINGASIILCVASCIIQGLCCGIYP